MDLQSPCGILVVDKPSGCTSHDVVNLIRRAFRTRQVGHTGTLDPMATGVMVLCLGMATRLAEYLTSCKKHYTAEFQFGLQSNSYDSTGVIVEQRDGSHLTRRDIENAAYGFVGAILQVPPMVSAVHHEGKRLYELAREGKVVERQPRKVYVDELELAEFTPGVVPLATFEITCSSGFYVRVLADDLGRALGVGAIMSSLRRSWVGNTPQNAFTVEEAVSLDTISSKADITELRKLLIPMEQAVASYPAYIVDEQSAIDQVSHGIALPIQPSNFLENSTAQLNHGVIMLFSANRRLLAVAREADGYLQPFKVFNVQ